MSKLTKLCIVLSHTILLNLIQTEGKPANVTSKSQKEMSSSSVPSCLQYVWTQKNDFPGAKRGGASAFSLNGYGYYGAGVDPTLPSNNVYKDFWKYSQGTDSWSTIADIPVNCYGPLEFALGDYGYVGTGWTVVNGADTNSFFKYDPTTNIWTPLAPFPGADRYTGIGLSNGISGFGGFGYAPLRKDFYQYDAIADVWTPTTTFPGLARQSQVGFNIGSDLYIGCGYTNLYSQDFWKYDPTNGTWTQVSDFPVDHYASVGFTMYDKGIVGTGRNGVNYFNSFYEYDPVLNLWSPIPSLPSNARFSADAFTIGNKGYVIGGVLSSGATLKEVWELSLAPTLTAVITAFGSVSFCAGGGVLLEANVDTGLTYQWKKYGNIIPGATSAQLVATTSGKYRCIITNSSGCTSSSNVIQVTVNPPPAATITAGGPTTFCIGDSVVLATTQGAGLTYKWKKYANIIPGATSATYTVKTTGKYKCIVTNSNGCSRTSASVSTVLQECRETSEVETKKPTLSVFPNPSLDKFTIKSDTHKMELSAVRITDINGRLVKPSILLKDDFSVEIDALENGIYIMYYQNEEISESVRLVKINN